MREEAVNESDLVREEKSESNAEHASRRTEMPMEKVEPRAAGDRHRNCRRHQHHARDRSETEDKEVGQRPKRSLNDGQNEECDGRGTSQTVNGPNDERAYRPIPFHATEDSIQTCGRDSVIRMAVRFSSMSVRVRVNVIAMTVRMLMVTVGRAVLQ